MMSSEGGPNAGTDSSSLTREEAQRRVDEILSQRERSDAVAPSRRARTILIIVLVILLLLLCGVGAFLYRLLAPGSGAGTDTGDSADTAGITWIRSIYGFGPEADQLFINPNDVATAPDGTIWITDPGHARVVGFRGDGTFVDIIQGSTLTGEPFRLASRIAIDPDGILYLVDRANETLTIMDGETKLASQNIPGVTSVDSDDQITVIGAESGLAILDKDGNVQTIVGTKGTGDDQFDSVGGVAIDSQTETIYAVDTYNNRLSAWDYEGTRKWIVVLGNPANDVQLEGGANLDTSSIAPSALQLPTDVTVDGNGRPVVLDAFDFTISAFSPEDGEFIDKWGNYGDSDGQFMYPSGFDYDPTRDWFTVADTQNLRAQIIRIDGSAPGGVTGARSWLSRLLAGPMRALWPCCILLPLLLLLLLLLRLRKRRRERNLQRIAHQQSVTPEHEARLSETSTNR